MGELELPRQIGPRGRLIHKVGKPKSLEIGFKTLSKADTFISLNYERAEEEGAVWEAL